MTVYVVAQLRFTDRAAYDRYQARFPGIFSRFDGCLLASDEHPQVIEGDWPWTKVVILSFPSGERFRAWHGSPEYQEIARERRAGAEGLVLLVQGMAGSFERGGGADFGAPVPSGGRR